MKLEFSKEFYKDEEREGFLVKSMVKRSWALQMEILSYIDEICERHDIQYFAFWGTMLGAVRHKGFVPWDDDMDIIMKRNDYEKFIEIARDELPVGYILLSIYSEQEWDTTISRITNSYSIDYNEESLLKSHGCPYICGIDIFPYDYIPDDKKKFDEMENILNGAAQAKDICKKQKALSEEGRKLEKKDEKRLDVILKDLEKRFGFTFSRDNYLQNQLLCLFDSAGASYGDSSCEFMTNHLERRERVSKSSDFRVPTFLLDEVIDYPFEGYSVKIPKYYEICLSKCYGKNFMTPIQGGGAHDYPFYSKQEKTITDLGKLEEVLCAVDSVADKIGVDNDSSKPEKISEALIEENQELRQLIMGWKQPDKKAILCCFSIMDAYESEEKFVKKLKDTIDFFKNQTDKICMILLVAPYVEEILARKSAALSEEYINLMNSMIQSEWALAVFPDQYYGIVDLCDAYYGSPNEYIKPFQDAKKPIMVQNLDILNS